MNKTNRKKISTDWYDENNISISNSVGIDEVGRGPLAGIVVTCAVWLDEIGVQMLIDSGLTVRDSKKLTFNSREKIINFLNANRGEHIQYSIGEASVDEIDSMNILQATMTAMCRAFFGLSKTSKIVLVDGNKTPNIENEDVRSVIKGDDKVLSISLASIIAKQHRDKIMIELSKKYPQYGWDSNIGYGTKKHIEAIEKYGVTPYHRRSFSPIKEMVK